jgi:hypothetical protein
MAFPFSFSGTIDLAGDACLHQASLMELRSRLQEQGADIVSDINGPLQFEVPLLGNGMRWTASSLNALDSGRIQLVSGDSGVVLRYEASVARHSALWVLLAVVAGEIFGHGSFWGGLAGLCVAGVLVGLNFWIGEAGFRRLLHREIRSRA